jgi:hypothetical protein
MMDKLPEADLLRVCDPVCKPYGLTSFPSPTSQSMLNRFLSGKTEAIKGPRKKRPYLATECRDLNEADKWRQEILREIGKKVMEVQNAALGATLA